MKKFIVLFLVFLVFSMPKVVVARNGDTVFFGEKTMVFDNSNNCTENGTCTLKEFRVTSKKFMVIAGGGKNFGTLVKAEYKTDSIGALKNYGFVMFIRGGKFSSWQDERGTVHKEFGFSKPQFGGVAPFYFANWTIDSVDKDPFFGSDSESKKERHHFYRWIDKGKETIYGRKKPATAKLYVVDHPGMTAFVAGKVAMNISLEVKMCIYKAKDIPKETDQNNINFAKPIHCFTVQNVFIYDHKSGKWTTTK